MSDDNTAKTGGMIKKCWQSLRRPSAKYSLLTLLIAGFIAGIIFWGGFNTALEVTNTEEFCISCHEMEDNVYAEYQRTEHYTNSSGIRATCPDCHVPKPWIHKVTRKIKASNELFHKVLGTIDTPEKFEAERLRMAEIVWRNMKKTDSRECRNCHEFNSMDFTLQANNAAKSHQRGLDENMTCIDCHKGIAHDLPYGTFNGQHIP